MSSSLPERLEAAYMEIGQHSGYWACIDEAADRIRELESALREYGRHHEPCPWWSNKPCSCGLDAIAPGSDMETGTKP